MARFSTAVTTALSATAATEELASLLEGALGGAEHVAGGLILATAAAGKQAAEVGRTLGLRWPTADLMGTSFEGIVAQGRIWRDRPALALVAWSADPDEPLALCFDPRQQDAHQIAHELLEAAGRSVLGPADVVVLFPDAIESPGLDRILKELGRLLGNPSIAGAAANGIDGHLAETWVGNQDLPGSMLAVLVPGGEEGGDRRVRSAGASRSASPWLEITACRSRWIDGLDGETPVDWIRRQLGIEPEGRVEPLLDRLLVRVCRRPAWQGELRETNGSRVYDERYVIGLDENRGSISLSGAFERGDQVALALPDPERARHSLRTAIDELPLTPLLLQFACRTRDETLHGDSELESAWVAYHASNRRILGTVSPFQFGSDARGVCQRVVHAAVLAALGRPHPGARDSHPKEEVESD